MFANVHMQRMRALKTTVIDHLLTSFANDGWENVYIDEITKDDYNKAIQIVELNTVCKIANNILNNLPFSRPPISSFLLEKIVNDRVYIYNFQTEGTSSRAISNDDDLVFLKHTDIEIKPKCERKAQPSKIRKPKVTKSKDIQPNSKPKPKPNPKPEKNSDPLREWCQRFLSEFASTESVDTSIDNIPSFKPTQSLLHKYQQKRNKDLLNWGSNF